MGTIHAAKVDKSEQLQLILHCLRHGGPSSTRTLAEYSNSCSVSTRISELRHQGYPIQCERKNGLYFYSLDSMNPANEGELC